MKAYENYQAALQRFAEADKQLTRITETIKLSRRAALAASRGMFAKMQIPHDVLGADHSGDLAAATREVITAEGARQYWRAVHAKAESLVLAAKREARESEINLRRARREFWDARLSQLLADFYEAHRAELVHLVAALFRQDEDPSGSYPEMNIFRCLQLVASRVDLDEIRKDAEEAAEAALPARVHHATALEGRDRAVGYTRSERIESTEVGPSIEDLARSLRVVRLQLEAAERNEEAADVVAEMRNREEGIAELIAEREAVL